MDRLSPQDASFLHVENDVNHMHIGSVAVFEGPVPAYAELEAMVAGKLPLAGRYRQRVRQVPLQLGRPVWADDPHFRLGYHLRHTALPRPGGRAELRTLVGRVMSQQLDRTKPLWELWLVEGLDDGHWALFTKVHHCMVDGVAGTDLLTVLLDDSPEPSSPVPDSWQPPPEPSGLRLAGDALLDYLASPYEQWRAARVAASAPLRLGRTLAGTARGLATVPGLIRVAPPPSSLSGPIGPHRRWAWARASLEQVRTIRLGLGGTVNDVVLAAVTRGFRELILARGAAPEQTPIRSLVPVSVRQAGERGSYGNRVSAVLADLPVAAEDPVERLAAVRRQMEDLKESRQAVAAETLTSLSGFAPSLLLALGTRVATGALGRFGRGMVDTVTTNVPGPQHPLYALGRRLVEACPYVPLVSPMRVGVAVFSYDGKLTFGVTADYDTVPDVEVLCRGIEVGMAELLAAAETVTTDN